jgi:hypothetical protein
MDSKLRVSAVVFVSVVCLYLLVPADCAAVNSRVSVDKQQHRYVCMLLCFVACVDWQTVG